MLVWVCNPDGFRLAGGLVFLLTQMGGLVGQVGAILVYLLTKISRMLCCFSVNPDMNNVSLLANPLIQICRLVCWKATSICLQRICWLVEFRFI